MGQAEVGKAWTEVWCELSDLLPILKTEVKQDAHGHGIGGHAAHGPEATDTSSVPKETKEDVEIAVERANVFDHNLLTQIIGVAILEFGVVLHRYLNHLVL